MSASNYSVFRSRAASDKAINLVLFSKSMLELSYATDIWRLFYGSISGDTHQRVLLQKSYSFHVLY